MMTANRDADSRVLSLDQFRGYTILGMILVNFIGYFDKIHVFFKHTDTFFSYADSIMPAFHLAVGFSYRLTMLRRLAIPDANWVSVWWSYWKRSFALVFIGVLLFGIGGNFTTWQQFSEMPRVPGLSDEASDSLSIATSDSRSFSETFAAQWKFWATSTVKSRMWNTLVIIGVTQIVILPFVATSFRTRILVMIAFGVAHSLLTYWFNWGFVVGEPENWMVQWWGTGNMLSWDGGIFGPLCWAIAMLAGTLCYDIVRSAPPYEAARVLIRTGVILMAIAWGLSCLSRLYDVDKGAMASKHLPENAASPMIPTGIDLSNASFTSFFAEPPLVAPPGTPSIPGTAYEPVRLRNYWMMIKQIPTLTFILCATGFGMLVYGCFVWLCDGKGWQLSLLNTFGTNALIAYILHSYIGDQVGKLVPPDSPVWYVLLGLLAFFLCTWIVVRYLEKQRIYIRL